MKRLFAFVLASLALLSGASAGTIMLGKYKNPESETFRVFNKMQLDGMNEGLGIYNAYLKMSNVKPLYCPPLDRPPITLEQVEQIMLGAAKNFKNPDDRPVSLLLLIGLTEAFPCK